MRIISNPWQPLNGASKGFNKSNAGRRGVRFSLLYSRFDSNSIQDKFGGRRKINSVQVYWNLMHWTHFLNNIFQLRRFKSVDLKQIVETIRGWLMYRCSALTFCSWGCKKTKFLESFMGNFYTRGNCPQISSRPKHSQCNSWYLNQFRCKLLLRGSMQFQWIEWLLRQVYDFFDLFFTVSSSKRRLSLSSITATQYYNVFGYTISYDKFKLALIQLWTFSYPIYFIPRTWQRVAVWCDYVLIK